MCKSVLRWELDIVSPTGRDGIPSSSSLCFEDDPYSYMVGIDSLQSLKGQCDIMKSNLEHGCFDFGGDDSTVVVMESSKEGKESKEPNTTHSQEPPSATSTGTPDWSGFQAYSPIPPHGFLASSPQAHAYMWGVQPLMPPHPYATPPHPYMAMYPHGGLYAHPSMSPASYPFNPYAMPSQNGIAEASVNTNGNPEADGKPSEAKEKLPIKRSKGSLGSLNMITGKTRESGKASGTSANGAYSKSAESASDGSSEGSEANSDNSGQRQDSDTSQNGSAAQSSQNGATMLNSMAVVPISTPGLPGGVPGPTTNLNIGMDYWGTAASPTVPMMQGKVPLVQGGGMATAARDGVQPQLWLQDERELKRQRRKQSNRESARRSRMRKQAECDELAQRAEVLKEENTSIREELNRMRSEYEELLSQNTALKEKLGEDDELMKNNVQITTVDNILHKTEMMP